MKSLEVFERGNSERTGHSSQLHPPEAFVLTAGRLREGLRIL